jgi:ADP-ribosylglycohydrolase
VSATALGPAAWTTVQLAERTYAGVLGKIIGVYYGRPVEGWSYAKIQHRFGLIDHYVADEVGAPLIIPDDDISGTFVYIRAAADHLDLGARGSEAVGSSWLNYTVEGKTVLWWGGLCRSTEHTAFLRLKDGISAPRSGSIELNGRSMAEGVGAQIFIDGWGMICPGEPDRAAAFAREAAHVSHDGLAVSAASFLAAMQALAYAECDVDRLIDVCLPLAGDARLHRLVDDVRTLCAGTDDWRTARDWIETHHGYRRYPGNSPMATNHAAVLMALLMGGDDFHRSIAICTSAGWDTDSNTGNLGCLNGIRLGLSGIEAGADLRAPVADRLYAVSSEGGECITDAVRETHKLLHARATQLGEPYEAPMHRFRFDLPGSVQGFAAHDRGTRQALTRLSNDGGALRLSYHHLATGAVAAVATPTFGPPQSTGIAGTSYFEVVASPTLYPTQTVRAQLRADDGPPPCAAFFIDTYGDDGVITTLVGPAQPLSPVPKELTWTVPDTAGRAVYRVGIQLHSDTRCDGSVALDWMDWTGAPAAFSLGTSYDLSPDLTPWTTDTAWLRTFVSSAANFAPDYTTTFSISHPETNGIVTTGTSDWDNYTVSSTITFNQQQAAGLVARTHGHRRYYAGLLRDGAAVLVKRRDDTQHELARCDFPYQVDAVHELALTVDGTHLTLTVDGHLLLQADDDSYASGGAGFVVDTGAILAKGFHLTAAGAST